MSRARAARLLVAVAVVQLLAAARGFPGSAAGVAPDGDACGSNQWPVDGAGGGPLTADAVAVQLPVPGDPPDFHSGPYLLTYSRAAVALLPNGLLLEAVARVMYGSLVLLRVNLTAAAVEAVVTLPCAGLSGHSEDVAIRLFIAASDPQVGDTVVAGAACGAHIVIIPPPLLPASPPSLQRPARIVWSARDVVPKAVSPDGRFVVSTDASGYSVRRVADGSRVSFTPPAALNTWGANPGLQPTIRILSMRDGSGYLFIAGCDMVVREMPYASLSGLCAFRASDGSLLWASEAGDPRLSRVAWVSNLVARDVRNLGNAPAPSCARGTGGSQVADQTAMVLAAGFTRGSVIAQFGFTADTGALVWLSELGDPRMLAAVAALMPPPPPRYPNATLHPFPALHAVCEVPGTDIFLTLLDVGYFVRNKYGMPQAVGSALICAVTSFRATTGEYLSHVVLAVGDRSCGTAVHGGVELFPVGHAQLVLGATCRTAFAVYPNVSATDAGARAKGPAPFGPLLAALAVDPWTGALSVSATAAPADAWLSTAAQFVFAGPCATCVTVSNVLEPVNLPPTPTSTATVEIGMQLAAESGHWNASAPRAWLAARYVVLHGSPLPPLEWPSSPAAWHPATVATGSSVATLVFALAVAGALLVTRARRPAACCRGAGAPRRHVRLPDDVPSV